MNSLTGMLDSAGDTTSSAGSWFIGSFWGGLLLLTVAIGIVSGLIYMVVRKSRRSA